jgi:hypothetical protein
MVLHRDGGHSQFLGSLTVMDTPPAWPIFVPSPPDHSLALMGKSVNLNGRSKED